MTSSLADPRLVRPLRLSLALSPAARLCKAVSLSDGCSGRHFTLRALI